MQKSGPILIIEDDADDRYLIGEAFKNIACGNEVVFLSRGEDALLYLRRDKVYPFLIIADSNMPMMSGSELREAIFGDEELRAKCIPYLVFTTEVSPKSTLKAYGASIQGLFKKPGSLHEMEVMFRAVLNYWQTCIPSAMRI